MKYTKKEINEIIKLSYLDQYEYFGIINIENITVANKLFWLAKYEFDPKGQARYCLISDTLGKIEYKFNFGKEEAIKETERFKNKYSIYDSHKLTKVMFNDNFDVVGKMAWIVTGEFELFGELRQSFFVVSAETGILEYTFNEHGRRNSHLEEI